MRLAPGSRSFSTSTRFAHSSIAMNVMPVMLRPGFRQAVRESGGDRVAAVDEHDGNPVAHGLGEIHRRAARNQDVDAIRDELGDERRQPREVVVGVARAHHVGLALDVAEVAQPFAQQGERGIGLGEVREPAHPWRAAPRCASALPGPSRSDPARQREEVAAVHAASLSLRSDLDPEYDATRVVCQIHRRAGHELRRACPARASRSTRFPARRSSACRPRRSSSARGRSRPAPPRRRSRSSWSGRRGRRRAGGRG